MFEELAGRNPETGFAAWRCQRVGDLGGMEQPTLAETDDHLVECRQRLHGFGRRLAHPEAELATTGIGDLDDACPDVSRRTAYAHPDLDPLEPETLGFSGQSIHEIVDL